MLFRSNDIVLLRTAASLEYNAIDTYDAAIGLGVFNGAFMPAGAIAKRLRDAQREIKNVGQYDYVLINDQLDRSAEALRAIVECERHRLTGSGIQGDGAKIRALAESCRTAAQRERVAPILEGFRD